MAQYSEITQLKLRHQRLNAEIQDMLRDFSLDYVRTPERKAALLQRIDALLNDFRKQAPLVGSREEYTWLADAAKSWQLICAVVLDVPKFIEVLQGPESFSEHTGRWTADAIYRWSKNKSYFIAKDRLELERSRIITQILGRNVEEMTSSDQQRTTDWVLAETFFCLDILKGDLDFCNCISEDLLDILSRVWLHDVLRLHAYMLWKTQKKEPFQINEAARQQDFYDACSSFRARIASKDSKCHSMEVRLIISDYIARKYLNLEEYKAGRYVLDRVKSNVVIKRRAQRSFDISQNHDMNRNYFHAEEYVRTFFENIIPSMLEDGETAARSRALIYETFEKSDGPNYYSSIATCLEGAILIYCVENLPHLEHKSRKRVIMYNDDITTVDFVEHVLIDIFNKGVREAKEIVSYVDREGKYMVDLLDEDMAAEKRDEVVRRAKEKGFPLQISLEAENSDSGAKGN